MAEKITLLIDLGKYKHITLPAEDASRLLNIITQKIGKQTFDVEEAQRYIANFDVFYEVMKKKFKDSLAPPKSINDMIRGNIIVDRVILIKENGERKVTIVFDRRIPVDKIKEALEELGYIVEIKRETMY